ncbi:TPA: hypothetical protein ACH3X1_015197 [Trebouxia sp. C0004]
MDLSALRQQILLSNKTASEKAETFLLKSQVNDLSKAEWRMWIAGIPEDVEKGIGRLKSAVQQEASLMLAQQQQQAGTADRTDWVQWICSSHTQEHVIAILYNCTIYKSNTNFPSYMVMGMVYILRSVQTFRTTACTWRLIQLESEV